MTFANADGAAACLAKDGVTFGERWLSIKMSAERAKQDASRGPSEKMAGCMTVFIGNLSWDVDEESVRATFADCGEITGVRFAEDRETGKFKGFGHVEFSTTEATDVAVALAGTDVCGRAIRVDFAAVKQRPAFGSGGFGGGGRGGGGRGSPMGGRGGGGRGGGGRGGERSFSPPNAAAAKKNGSIGAFSGSKTTFD
jgi:nucleolin